MPSPASGLNDRWCMGFLHNQLANGLEFRVLTVVDNSIRESVLLEAGFRLTSREVVMTIDQAAQSRKLTASITVDHGT
jgi:putative transposase